MTQPTTLHHFIGVSPTLQSPPVARRDQPAAGHWRALLSPRAEIARPGVKGNCRAHALKLQHLIREHQAEIAQLITREHGKTLLDAGARYTGNLEVVNAPAPSPRCSSARSPRTPPRAWTCTTCCSPWAWARYHGVQLPRDAALLHVPHGDRAATTVLKPSEQVSSPCASSGAGARGRRAAGRLNVIHGGPEVADVSATTRTSGAFRSSAHVLRIYRRASRPTTRAVDDGRQNHCVVMPDTSGAKQPAGLDLRRHMN